MGGAGKRGGWQTQDQGQGWDKPKWGYWHESWPSSPRAWAHAAAIRYDQVEVPDGKGAPATPPQQEIPEAGIGDSSFRKELQRCLTSATRADAKVRKIKEDLAKKKKQFAAYEQYMMNAFYKQKAAHEKDMQRLEQDIHNATAQGKEAAEQVQVLTLYGASTPMEADPAQGQAWEQLLQAHRPETARPPSDFLVAAYQMAQRAGIAPLTTLSAADASALTPVGLADSAEHAAPATALPPTTTTGFGPPGLEAVLTGPFAPSPNTALGMPSTSPVMSPGARVCGPDRDRVSSSVRFPGTDAGAAKDLGAICQTGWLYSSFADRRRSALWCSGSFWRSSCDGGACYSLGCPDASSRRCGATDLGSHVDLACLTSQNQQGKGSTWMSIAGRSRFSCSTVRLEVPMLLSVCQALRAFDTPGRGCLLRSMACDTVERFLHDHVVSEGNP